MCKSHELSFSTNYLTTSASNQLRKTERSVLIPNNNTHKAETHTYSHGQITEQA